MYRHLVKAILGSLVVAVPLACGTGPESETPDRNGGRPEPVPPGPPAAPASYVGAASCRDCHLQQWRLWQGSHHDLAMQPANEATVLGDFDGASLTHFDLTTTFSRRGGDFVVRTEGPNGELGDFPVAWVFGIEPLQQYLVDIGGGRIQALATAWDTRPAASGGQRWFHLYPEERMTPGDPLHWSGRDQRWNFMCAECHSTDVAKNYDVGTDSYATTWAEIDVACESCHGPASRHLQWAESPQPGTANGIVSLAGGQAAWIMDPGTGIAQRGEARTDRSQTETCARCHARRAALSDDYRHGRPLLDTHRLSLLDEPLYFPDGQIREEVYVHGSFLQSRMYRAGVTCSDCHDPHSLQVRGSGNARCAACHLPARYDTPQHHFHPHDTDGAQCIECHMPARTYMGVDPRRDHSFRVPRPDLTEVLGVPNACTSCHRTETPSWAAARIAGWYGEDRRSRPHYGEILRAARDAAPGADLEVLKLARDTTQPGIVRATAIGLATPRPTPAFFDGIRGALADPDALVRLAALGPLARVEPSARFVLAGGLLRDPVRAVRIEAARLLAEVPERLLPAEAVVEIAAVLLEYRAALRLNADRPESWLELGLLELAQGDPDAAEEAYQHALELDSRFVPAYLDLADLRRSQGRDPEAEPLLRRAVALEDHAATHHALGLLLVRLGRLPEALQELADAAAAAPESPRYAYVYGVALETAGRAADALDVLARHHRRHPADADTLTALATLSRKHERFAEALAWARRLADLDPNAAGPRQLVRELEALQPDQDRREPPGRPGS